MFSSDQRAARGFSYVEVLIALTILLAAMGPLLHVAASAQRLARSHGEATDLHQRVRVAATRLQRDVANAGAGAIRGPVSESLARHLAPLVPARTGARAPDPPLSAFSDRLSIVYVAQDAWPAPLAVDMSDPSQPIPIGVGPGCPPAGLCGFVDGTRALIMDAREVGGGHDLFTVTGIAGELSHDPPNPPLHRAYRAATSIVVPVVQRVYYLDRAGRRLMVYDGYQTDMPLVDNVVDVRFAFFADASPASVARPSGLSGSCVYDAGSPPAPRLADFGREGLHELTVSELTDGPICGAGPAAFDGDLLRIRLVRVTLRLEAAAADVRGIGPLFARPGRSASGYSYVPDHELTFDIAPRNLTPAVLGR